MESSRDSGWRHDAGKFVQFCACRKPTITICRAMLVSLQINERHPEEAVRGAHGRLEGWKQAWCLFPSFETLGAARRAPQDDGGVCCTSVCCTHFIKSSSAAKPYSPASARSLSQVASSTSMPSWARSCLRKCSTSPG